MHVVPINSLSSLRRKLLLHGKLYPNLFRSYCKATDEKLMWPYLKYGHIFFIGLNRLSSDCGPYNDKRT